MSEPVTREELAAAEARVEARQALLKELDELTSARDRAKAEATITLVVAVDRQCAQGLRRKTRTGHEFGYHRPPREALREVDKALTAWYAVDAEHKLAIDAKLAEIDRANPQFREDWALIGRWIKENSPTG